MTYRHVSAMLSEVLTALDCHPGGVYVDCTLGGAGHASAICEKIAPAGTLVGIDQDRAAIDHARKVLESYAVNTHLFHGNFIDLPNFLEQLHLGAVDGILLDLGLSQYQLENSGRGFTFMRDEPLDMRMDLRSETRAADLVNRSKENELVRIFQQYGEERWSRRIARSIVSSREKTPIQTSGQLVEVVRRAIPAGAAAKRKIHPATKIFMALRIAVNQELERLEQFLGFFLDLLRIGGRLCVLSFHSLEDRMVKQRFKALVKGCTCPPQWPKCMCNQQPRVRLIFKRVVRPGSDEISANPMARSTRLRAVEKIAE